MSQSPADSPSDQTTPAVTPSEPAGETPLPADIAELSYEAARDQLVEEIGRASCRERV